MPMRTVLLALLLASIAGCASPDQPMENPFVGWYKGYDTCRAEYAAVDARVEAAGVGYAGYYRVPGYPYLRTDRMLASFAHEVKSLEEVGGWMRRMRETDQEAREFEYINLGMTKQEAAIQRDRFLNCGRTLASVEFLDQPKAFAHLLSVVEPRDEYSSLQRVIGLHALTAPLMRSRIEARQQALEAAYAQPVEQLAADAPLTLWTAKPEADLSLIENIYARVFPDELGFPGLVDSQWRALAEYYAPQLWIETASEADRLALPVLTQDGPSADPARPQVHYHVGFTRFGGKPLVQIQYLFWFKGANGEAPLDGFVWRMTLDDQARPLVYESMHTSGRDHRWYPVQPLAVRERNGDAQGIPVIAPLPAPARLATARIKAGTHEIVRIVEAQATKAQATQTYEIRRYDDLLAMPFPGGGKRSLFGPDGLVPGPHDGDPIGGFSSGIRQPGALRQLGRHPIAHVGRAHFDEPFLLESVFVPPTTPRS